MSFKRGICIGFVSGIRGEAINLNELFYFLVVFGKYYLIDESFVILREVEFFIKIIYI